VQLDVIRAVNRRRAYRSLEHVNHEGSEQ